MKTQQFPSQARNSLHITQVLNSSPCRRVHDGPPLISIFGQTNPVHSPLSLSVKDGVIFFCCLRLGLLSDLLPPGSPTKLCKYFSCHACRMFLLPNPPTFQAPNSIQLGVYILELLIMPVSAASSYVFMAYRTPTYTCRCLLFLKSKYLLMSLFFKTI